jgi:hypothetical protein
MKFLVIALMAMSANAQTILDQCYQASYATDYVYENIVTVTVSETTPAVLEGLASPSLKVLSEKENRFTVKADLSDWYGAEAALETLRALPNVAVSCKYKL